ncbi:ATP-dependent Clp protease proteolytic subunit [Candidatus Saccharibacteria bacterium]|nr:ATP-dependent Clp protease proteolytic subunit [Candidatus Saccharibacteria bacterium]
MITLKEQMLKGEAPTEETLKEYRENEYFFYYPPIFGNEMRIACNMEEYTRIVDAEDRRLYLYDTLTPLGDCDHSYDFSSTAGKLVEQIIEYNRMDRGLPVSEREPIRLYINSPGGDQTEGFSLVDTIKLSKTPVYTINTGQWSSMSFLIGITGHRRFSYSSATFLLHDGSSGAFGSVNKVQDRVKFEERYEQEIVKNHVLDHSNMTSSEYDALARVEYYMLPDDALRRGFIDEIVKDIDTIL